MFPNFLISGKGRSVFQPDKSKYKRDIDVVRENHRFLWEDDEGEEISEKELKWEQSVAKKYWDKLFTEYAICDLTYFKSKCFIKKLNFCFFDISKIFQIYIKNKI